MATEKGHVFNASLFFESNFISCNILMLWHNLHDVWSLFQQVKNSIKSCLTARQKHFVPPVICKAPSRSVPRRCSGTVERGTYTPVCSPAPSTFPHSTRISLSFIDSDIPAVVPQNAIPRILFYLYTIFRSVSGERAYSSANSSSVFPLKYFARISSLRWA